MLVITAGKLALCTLICKAPPAITEAVERAIKTTPEELITNGVASGLVLSSTTKALPAPVLSNAKCI